MLPLAFFAFGVSGNSILENDEIVPLIVGGTAAAAGEFQGKVSVILKYLK